MSRMLRLKLTTCIPVLFTGITLSCAAQERCSELTARLQAALNGQSKEKAYMVLNDFSYKECCGKSLEQESLIVNLVLDKWSGARDLDFEELQEMTLLPTVVSPQQGTTLYLDGLISRDMWSEWVICGVGSFDDLPAEKRRYYIQAFLSAIWDGKVKEKDQMQAAELAGRMIAVYPDDSGFNALSGLYREHPKNDQLAMDLVVAAWKLGKKIPHDDASLILDNCGSEWSFDLWSLSGTEVVMGKDDALRLKQLREKNGEEHSLNLRPIKAYSEANFTTLRIVSVGAK